MTTINEAIQVLMDQSNGNYSTCQEWERAHEFGYLIGEHVLEVLAKRQDNEHIWIWRDNVIAGFTQGITKSEQ